jgi:predicted DNA-binding transcriptional regulator AlpA
MSRKLITAGQVCELIPGLTKSQLAQLRYSGRGPKFFKPTPRLVLYDEADIYEWIERSAQLISGQ